MPRDFVPPTPRRPPDVTSERAAARRAGERNRAGREREQARRKRAIRRQRLLAFGLLALVGGAIALTVALAGSGPARTHGANVTGSSGASQKPPPSTARPSSYAVGLRIVGLLDTSRTINLPDGTSEPRTLTTEVRYPALGAPSAIDVPNAPAARADGPFPLVIFGHGFARTPGLYARLLQTWAQAGYVVAAPVFPLENAHAPGGPDESDLINQPADMRFVISRMLAASNASSGPLAGLIDPKQIAVTGQSDGGDTALAVAYDGPYRDPRVGAAIILSGAEIPALSSFTFPRGGPPLLAAQGTADTINPPSATSAFFDIAQRPKYLLKLLGAEHLPPYSDQQPQLTIVERVTIAFLDGYLKHTPGALQRLDSLGNVTGTATMLAEP
jgi:dienelactone hydrolase